MVVSSFHFAIFYNFPVRERSTISQHGKNDSPLTVHNLPRFEARECDLQKINTLQLLINIHYAFCPIDFMNLITCKDLYTQISKLKSLESVTAVCVLKITLKKIIIKEGTAVTEAAGINFVWNLDTHPTKTSSTRMSHLWAGQEIFCKREKCHSKY